jgi:hypothetical protein
MRKRFISPKKWGCPETYHQPGAEQLKKGNGKISLSERMGFYRVPQ